MCGAGIIIINIQAKVFLLNCLDIGSCVVIGGLFRLGSMSIIELFPSVRRLHPHVSTEVGI